MYRFLTILPFFILFLATGWGFLYTNYVKVDQRIIDAFKNKRSDELRSIVLNREFNWFQRTSAIEKYAQLGCYAEDSFIRMVLGSPDTSLRRGVLAGCLTHSPKIVEWLIPLGLRDAYSFNRYQTLYSLRRDADYLRFEDMVRRLAEDSSSMVSNEANELLKMIDQSRKNIGQ